MVLSDNVGEDVRVVLGDFPKLAHLLEGGDEEMDLWVDFAFHRCGVDEEESGGYPEREGEGRAEKVEPTGVDYVLSNLPKALDRREAFLCGVE